MGRLLMGTEFIQWLIQKGVIAPQAVRRVIIDAQYNEVVTIYVETLGAEGQLQFSPPDLSRARITIVGTTDGAEG